MSYSALPIISIVQSRVDAFIEEIFDICQSHEANKTANSLWGTIATEFAIYDAVDVVIRRGRNKRTLFAHLPTDVVHSIFGMTLDVDRVHDPYLPLDQLDDNRQQLFHMRLVSSAWNGFLISSPRYWQAINVTSPPQVITAGIERSGSAPLCIYCFSKRSWSMSIHLPEELRSCTRLQTLRSDNSLPSDGYHLFRSLLRDPAPVLQTLQLTGPYVPTEDNVEPLGDLPSIRHLRALWWQPPSDAAWLVGLQELTLIRTSDPDLELLRILSACANIERLAIVQDDITVNGELPLPPGAISPIALPRLQSVELRFHTNESAMKLIRRLIIPQCRQRTLHVEKAQHLGRYVADYRRFMLMEESCTQYPRSARIHIERVNEEKRLIYETDSRRVVCNGVRVEEVSAVQDLVQELRDLFKGPLLTVTVDCCFDNLRMLSSLSEKNIRTIVAHFRYSGRDVGEVLKAIGERSANNPDETLTNNAIDWPFKSLRSIEIHDAHMNLDDFQRQVEGYLHKSSKPFLGEIVLVGCSLRGPELAQATERIAAIGIILRGVECKYD